MANSAQQFASSSRQGIVTLENPKPAVTSSVNLMIAGQRLSIKTDQDPAELVSMAQEINANIDAIRKCSPGASTLQVMALALMQIMERAKIAEKQDAFHCHVIEQHTQRLEMLLAAMESSDSLK